MLPEILRVKILPHQCLWWAVISGAMEMLFYFSSPGARDENGALLKYGGMRISFEPDIFKDAEFEQKLKLSMVQFILSLIQEEPVSLE